MLLLFEKNSNSSEKSLKKFQKTRNSSFFIHTIWVINIKIQLKKNII